MKKQRLEFIGQVETRRAYSDAMRKRLISLCLWTIWLSKKGKLAVQYAKAKEHASWLVGDKHPTQEAN